MRYFTQFINSFPGLRALPVPPLLLAGALLYLLCGCAGGGASSGPGQPRSSSGHAVQLSWKPGSSSVSGYNVYRATTDGGPYTKMNTQLITASTFTDSTVNSGNTYYYVSTSVDPSGRESQYSAQATAKVP